MGRRKLSMELIENKKKRMRTFANRKQGLIKKASELSTLCDVQTAVIIYGSGGGGDDHTAHVWPNEPDKLYSILNRYNSTSLDERLKKAQDMSSLLVGKTPLLDPQVKHDHDHGNMMVNGPALDDAFINGLSVEQLMGLCSYLDAKIGLVETRIEMMKRSNLGQQQQQQWSKNMRMMMQPSLGYVYGEQYYGDYEKKMSADDELMGLMMMNDTYNSNPNNNVDVCANYYGTGLIQVGGVQNHQILFDRVDSNGGGSSTVDDAKPISCYRDPLELLNSNMPLF